MIMQADLLDESAVAPESLSMDDAERLNEA